MKQTNSFGKRGVPASERGCVNPYTGRVAQGSGYFMRGASHTSAVDEGLRAFMLAVYNYLFAGLTVTGLSALATYMLTVTTDPSKAMTDEGYPLQITDTEYLTELGGLLWMTPLSYVVGFGPLAILLFTGNVWRDVDPGPAKAVFFAVAALIGVSFSALALTYTNGSIAQMFFATAAGFGALSLWGYTTGKDLSGWGSFLFTGLFSLIAAAILNVFMGSHALTFAICSAGILIFSAFTAYDTQMIKQAYSERMGSGQLQHLAIKGALDLYLDFVNLFRFLLYFFGEQE